MAGVWRVKYTSVNDHTEHFINFYILNRDIPFSTQRSRVEWVNRYTNTSGVTDYIHSNGGGDYDLKRYISFTNGQPDDAQTYDIRLQDLWNRSRQNYTVNDNEKSIYDSVNTYGISSYDGTRITGDIGVYRSENYPIFWCIEPSQIAKTTRVAFMARTTNGRYELYTSSSNVLFADFFSTNPNFGEDSETGGGFGNFDMNTDSIDFPGVPDTGALDTGLIRMYNPTDIELTKLSKFLWSADLATNLIKVLNDPMEALISLNMFPIAPEVTTTKNNIIFGNLKAFEETAPDTYQDITSYQLTSQYKTFDCGTINLAEHFGSALDYAPYTKLEIFIPFSGMHEINIDDVMDGSIQLKYNIDFLTGAFVATVKCTKSNKYNLAAVIYHWSGVMAVPLPVTAASYTQKIASTIQALTTVTTALSTGSPAAIASGVAGGVMNMMNAKPHIQKSGNTGMIAGAMDNLTPYLILTRPVQSKPEDYQNYKGWTSNITTTLSSLQGKGYTEIAYAHVDGMTATDAEKTEIENLLKEGVIL